MKSIQHRICFAITCAGLTALSLLSVNHAEARQPGYSAAAAPSFPSTEVYYYNGDSKVTLHLALDELYLEEAGASRAAVVAETQDHLKNLSVDAMVIDSCCEEGGVYVRLERPTNQRELSDLAETLEAMSPGRAARPVFYSTAQTARADKTQITGTTRFSIKVADGEDFDALANRYGFSVVKEIDYSPNTWIVEVNGKGLVESFDVANALKENERGVEWATPLMEKWQTPRFTPNDPIYSDQWHLRNTGSNSGGGGVSGEDVNVVGAWTLSPEITGDGVTIAIVDDGLQHTHEDLAANSRTDIDIDICGNDTDPSPQSGDIHGTACAGVSAAVGGNGIGVTGAAPEAALVGVRLIACFVSDGEEADAMNHQATPASAADRVDISSNSWGPFDDAGRLEKPGPLTEAALLNGVTNGRGGLGTIYAWAAGNGRQSNDNVNYDGYANSRYTIAVGATGEDGTFSYYSEEGAAMLINTSSNDGVGVVTTDVTGSAGYNGIAGNNNYTNSFGGTSSACPLAAGLIALMLEANPTLTWRDVQHILVTTAEKNNPGHSDWETNGAGLEFNHAYGFGRIDGTAAVVASQTWTNVPDDAAALTASSSPGIAIPDNNPTGVQDVINIDAPDDFYTEHVYVTVNATHPWRGDLKFTLVSPDGTESRLTEPHGDPASNYSNWRMMTVASWGEDPDGDWTLKVSDGGPADLGTLNSWTLNVHGHIADVSSGMGDEWSIF